MADTDMMECNCGFPTTRGEIERSFMVLTLKGRHLGHPDEDSEDEHEIECPECGARESFFDAEDPDGAQAELAEELAANRAACNRSGDVSGELMEFPEDDQPDRFFDPDDTEVKT